MSSNKAARSSRRHLARLTVVRQMRIYKQDLTNTWAVKHPGKFRKSHSMNCGRSHCMLCVNPRRTWNRVTLQELIADEAFSYAMREVQQMRKIVINGKTVEVEADNITYEDVVRLAGMREGVVYTVVHDDRMNRAGHLFPGQSIPCSDTLRIDISFTGNA